MTMESSSSTGSSFPTSAILSTAHLLPTPHPLRRIDADRNIDDLAASIRREGILQPLIVRCLPERPGTFEVVAGNRRLRAAVTAGLTTVPCIVYQIEADQAFVLSLIENIQRDNLHPLDEAWAYDYLIESKMAHNRAEVARRLGVTRGRITQKMQLLQLDETTKLTLIEYGATLTEFHARLLLKVENLDARHQLAEEAGRCALSGRELREMIEQLGQQVTFAFPQQPEQAMAPRSHKVSIPGLRLFINYATVHPSRALQMLERVVTRLEDLAVGTQEVASRWGTASIAATVEHAARSAEQNLARVSD